jgi:hypothetical protein
MKLPADGACHYEAGFPQTIDKMIGADAGQEYVGLPRKAPASRNRLAQDGCDLFVR